MHRFLRLVTPSVEQTHVFDAETIDFPHSSVENSVRLPPVFAAFPSGGVPFAIDGLLDTFLHTAVEYAHALQLLRFFSIRLVEASAVNIGFP